MLDPKAHYSTTGIQQGRLGTCAKRLSDYEALRYLNQNPELQRLFGKAGASSLQQAREHWQNTGYKNAALAASIVDKENTPFKCASGPSESCLCPGTLWFGLQARPDNGAKIEGFDELREWRTYSAESDDWQACSSVEFGSDPMPGAEKQCFCEVKPQEEASRCADEGDECICNGHVYFASRLQADRATPATFMDTLENGFAVLDSNNTGTVSCSSDSFEGADPAPDAAKQCFCDDRKTFTSQADLVTLQEYWRQQTTLSTTESEIQTIITTVSEAESSESSFADATYSDDDGDGDATAAGCQLCDDSCAADSEKTLTTEIEKQRTVITKKYTKQKEHNKQKKVVAHNKRVQGDNACTAAQRAKDPAEKKKQRRMCRELREESSKLTTEAEIELQNILDQQHTEERTITEVTNKAVNEHTQKQTGSKKTHVVNKSIVREQTSSRITSETEERISLIKKKIETERIEQTMITSQTTAIEKQVTNIQTQIEEVENQLTRELKHEREESLDAAEETDTTSTEVDEELTTVVEEKQAQTEKKITKTTEKITSLKTKVTDLEETIQTSTKKIVETKAKIEKTTSATTTLVREREEKRQSLKVVSTSEQTRIQTEIDELTSKITDNRKEIETLETDRETSITEETTARTELTFTSQSLKKTEVYEEHLKEVKVITDVVIKNKKDKITEETTKKEIIDKQVTCFKKKQELESRREKVKQFKSTVNKKINKMKKWLEEKISEQTSAKEDLKTSETTLKTYEEQLKNTKETNEQEIIKVKIETITKEITEYTRIVSEISTTITTYTT